MVHASENITSTSADDKLTHIQSAGLQYQPTLTAEGVATTGTSQVTTCECRIKSPRWTMHKY